MKRLVSSSVILALALCVAGCGGGATGPADPSETPVMTEEQVQDAYTKGMPPEAKKMYEQYKKGGTPGRP